MAISMITDLDAEAQLTIGAYTPASSEPNTMNTVAIKGDEVSLISNFIAGENLGARATLAFGSMINKVRLQLVMLDLQPLIQLILQLVKTILKSNSQMLVV